ncbi:hypothetical protein [Halalkalibaculum sp. DA384]
MLCNVNIHLLSQNPTHFPLKMLYRLTSGAQKEWVGREAGK